jgi:hypothetical protein
MAVKKISHVQMVAPKGDDELAVKTRLRILLQLALTIGRREGLLSNGHGAQDETSTSEDSDKQSGITPEIHEEKENGQSQTV